MKSRQNIFTTFLDLLKVKHTKEFSERYFNEHPHKYNLLGLSKMLSDYGIENAGARIADKDQNITEIATPFIAHFSGDFVVVHKIESEKVTFLWNGIEHVLPFSEFNQAWTGIVLLAESSEKSIEPEYKEHKKVELLNGLKKTALFSAFSLILIFIYIGRSLNSDFGISILILLNFLGIFISWLLLLKQMRVQSQYADKICSLFKQSDCNSILDSKASKLFGIFSWSEIGFSYFSVNALLLLLLPHSPTFLALLNILTLPFSFWSVWYQLKVKQWCVLCLIVQAMLWVLFIANYLLGCIQIQEFGFNEAFYLIFIGICYFAAVLSVNTIVPKLNTDKAVTFIRQAYNALKADDDVFSAVLKKQPYYETKDSFSIIRFGNPEGLIHLTILTNPYCNPCSLMHKRIEKLLQDTKNNISVQYILSSFSENLNSTNKLLIASCLANKNDIEQIFTDWFEKGKALRDDYFKDKNFDMENPEIESEFKRHEDWRNKTQIRATPTILVNGYKLPDNYKIEDLRYFVEFEIGNVK